MEHRTTSEVLRLDRLEKRAKTYFKLGKDKGNLTRLVRAARLETKANSKMIKIITCEIEAFSS
jgi:hypothetical protein